MNRFGFNVHAQRVPDQEYLLQTVRAMQPKWMLVMDGIGLCQQIKAQVPACNVISRIYPDENWSTVNAKDWVANKKAEIQGADLWCYTFNEVGSSPEYLQLNADIITEAAKVGLKVVVGNMSVGTPANPADWETTAGHNLMTALNTHRSIAVLGLHEYGCAVVTSGFYGGYPDNAGVAPGQTDPPGQNLIPQANWPAEPAPCYHLGRFKFLLDACERMNIPPPRIVLTEHGFDDVSDIKAWTQTLHMTPPYTSIRGWKSIKNQWQQWYPGWSHEQAYFEQLKYADATLYQGSPVEAQLLFCWGHTSDMWDQFDVAHARDLHTLLASLPPETDNGGNGEPPSMTRIDLLPYLNGNGVRKVYKLGHNQAMGGGVELLQTQLEGSAGGFRHVKQGGAEQFSKWERLLGDAHWIYRDLDTSGQTDVYRLKDADLSGWSRWCPRYMVVGEKYHRNPVVTWYKKSTGAVVGAPGHDPSDIRLVAVIPSLHLPESGITIADAVELEWIPNGRTDWEEKYWYAKGYGLVAWQNRAGWRSFVSELSSPYTPVPEDLSGTWDNPPAPPNAPPPNSGAVNPPKPSNATDPVAVPIDGQWKLRAEPDTSAAQIGMLKTGETVTMYRVPETNNDNNVWHFIERGVIVPAGEAIQGYTAAPIPAAPEPPIPAEPLVTTMTVTIEAPAGTDMAQLESWLAKITRLTFRADE